VSTKHYRKLGFFVTIAVVTLGNFGLGPFEAALSEVALFDRCYSDVTGMRIHPNNPRLAQVKQGAPALEMCSQLLDEVELITSGDSEGTVREASPERISVFRTFHSVFRSFIPGSFDGTGVTGARAALDETNVAAFFTWAMFDPRGKVSDLTTSTVDIETVRATPGTDNREVIGVNDRRLSRATGPDTSDFEPIPFYTMATGNVIGAILQSAVKAVDGSPKSQMTGYLRKGTNFPAALPLFGTVGGGVIGSYTYLAMSFNLPSRRTADGGIYLARRWSESVARNLMCLNPPALRLSDAAPYVTPEDKVVPATPPFRTSSSCMSCHVTLDGMAMTIRNVTAQSMPGVPNREYPVFPSFTVGLAREAGLVNADASFHRRPPWGTLMFRDYNGTLVNHPVQGVQELGERIAQTDQFYACTAARLYQYFLGVDVSPFLYDPGDPANSPLTEDAEFHKQNVIQLGQALKNHQSLKQTAIEILHLPAYQTLGRGTGGE